MPKKIDWEEIRKYWQQTGASSSAIASVFGVSKRSVDDRIPQWRTSEKPSIKVVQLQPLPKVQNREPIFRRNDTLVIDDTEAIQSAIAELHTSLSGAEDKSKGGIAGALAKLIELKRKLSVTTAADLAERAIELGIGPDEFMQALSDLWQKRA